MTSLYEIIKEPDMLYILVMFLTQLNNSVLFLSAS